MALPLGVWKPKAMHREISASVSEKRWFRASGWCAGVSLSKRLEDILVLWFRYVLSDFGAQWFRS